MISLAKEGFCAMNEWYMDNHRDMRRACHPAFMAERSGIWIKEGTYTIA